MKPGLDLLLGNKANFRYFNPINSRLILQVIIEEEFNIKIEDEELIPDNLDSVNNVTNYIIKKLKRVGSSQSSLLS